MSINDNPASNDKLGKDEFFDAVCRHICHVLDFDYCLIDTVAGHEIVNFMSFTADSKSIEGNEQKDDLIATLTNEHQQSLKIAHTLIAQKVKQTHVPWLGKAFSKDGPKEGYPYIIIPITTSLANAQTQVKGLARVVSLNTNRQISENDISTLKLFCEQLAGKLPDDAETPQETFEPEFVPAQNAETILVVHTSRHVRRKLCRVLLEKYRVHEADSEDKSLALLEEFNIDLVILDCEAQGQSNYALCKKLKNSEKWKHIPIILIASEHNTVGKVEGLNAGAEDCLMENCHEAELSARVRASLHLRKAERDLAVQSRLLEDYAQRLEQEFEKVREINIKNSKSKQLLETKNLELEQSRLREQLLSGQAETLQRISDIIRKSFNINENMGEMLELLAERYSLDCCFAVLPSEDEPQDTIRCEYTQSSEYDLVEHSLDLKILEIFKEYFPHDQTLVVSDVSRDRSIQPFRKEILIPHHVRSLFYIPITYENKLLGLLGAHRCETEAMWSMENKSFFETVSDQVAIGVTSARLYARVQRQATTDGLTGLFNHRNGQEKLADQLKLAERYQRSISVVMIDVDHFKSINDTYGHPAGDTVLQTVSHLIRINCRDVDIPIRYGGEEFLLVLPEVNQDGAKIVAERIRHHIAQQAIKLEQGEISVTASFGIASYPEDAHSSQNLLELADKALYMSKRLGRNQIHTAHELSFSGFVSNPKAESIKAASEAQKDVAPPPAPALDETPSISSIPIENTQPEIKVQEVVNSVKDLAAALYAKSEYNKTHHLETARFAELLARIMGLSKSEVEQIRVAGLLHDIGILSIPDEIINKPGLVTDEEMDMITQHPELGVELLRPIQALKEICIVVEHHHECWDGTGYPHGLKGEDIPLASRILSIVDAYHAMISDRPYRTAMTQDQAKQSLKNGAGSQWDPFLVDIFTALLDSIDKEKPNEESQTPN